MLNCNLIHVCPKRKMPWVISFLRTAIITVFITPSLCQLINCLLCFVAAPCCLSGTSFRQHATVCRLHHQMLSISSQNAVLLINRPPAAKRRRDKWSNKRLEVCCDGCWPFVPYHIHNVHNNFDPSCSLQCSKFHSITADFDFSFDIKSNLLLCNDNNDRKPSRIC